MKKERQDWEKRGKIRKNGCVGKTDIGAGNWKGNPEQGGA